MATENKMGVMPLNRLLISMSVPMMISMLVQALYNIVDSMFVAQLSENALTAVSLAFPAQNLMIAVGGGTVLDVAKILSLRHVSPILDLYDGKLPVEKGKELILVPTTCGTGTEVTNISILSLVSRRTKKGLANDAMYADQAVLIPELLGACPSGSLPPAPSTR